MKKLLQLLFILLLLGVGFLYVVKNPDLPLSQKILSAIGIDLTTETPAEEIDLTHCLNYFDGCNTCFVSGGVIGGCTRMFCETPSEPYCMEYEWTGMDLTNCISYFDGCNNCTVENGRPSACTLMYCETPSEPKCNEYASGSLELTGDEKSIVITINEGYITQVYSTGGKNFLKIDYVEFGAMGDGGAPEIINNNTMIRTFEVANTTIFNVLKYDTDGGQESQNIQRDEFVTRGNGLGNPDPYHPTYYGGGGANGSIVTIEHDGQMVYKVTENYRP